jgi:hypothetical protein
MKNKFRIAAALMFLTSTGMQAQTRLTVDKVYSTYSSRNGTIMENNQIKGYYFLYLSDKIDKNTNEYTLQILDENVNKVKDIKFQDSKKLRLLEAAYNGSTLAFLFKNSDEKTLDMKIYGLDGTLKYSYSRGYDKRTDRLMDTYEAIRLSDEGANQNVFDLGKHGYASVLPLRDGKQRTYEVDFYSSEEKKQWTYIPEDDEERYSDAEFLGSTDNLIILEVLKKDRKLSGKPSAHLVAIDFATKKKAFDIDNENDEYTFVPSNVTTEAGTGKIMVVGNYFDKNDNIMKDVSKGVAIYAIDSKGKVLSKTYNSWADDFAKYLPLNKKGKVDNIGYLFTQKVIQVPGGKMFLVGEGYKRQASAGGIALNALAMMGGGRSSVGVTKIVVTDMVILEFNNKYKVSNATVYDKTNNTAEASSMSDYNSQHAIAMYLKMRGAFDYNFTTVTTDNSSFAVCYSDWVRSSDYKGETFNSIRYDGTKFSTDKIELKSKASTLKIFPAKPGSVMIMEYFKKEKRLDFRIEKLS